MTNAFCSCLLIIAAIATVEVPAAAQAPYPAFVYSASGSCLNSPEGFNSKLEPVNSGVAWTTAFNTVGSVDANGNFTEVGQSVDTASFGVGPRMHVPAASAYNDGFTSTVTANSEGSYTIVTGKLSGRFTDGPYAGQTFTATPGVLFKRWPGQGEIAVEATTGPPVVQVFTLSNGISFQRICTVRTVVTSPPH